MARDAFPRAKSQCYIVMSSAEPITKHSYRCTHRGSLPTRSACHFVLHSLKANSTLCSIWCRRRGVWYKDCGRTSWLLFALLFCAYDLGQITVGMWACEVDDVRALHQAFKIGQIWEKAYASGLQRWSLQQWQRQDQQMWRTSVMAQHRTSPITANDKEVDTGCRLYLNSWSGLTDSEHSIWDRGVQTSPGPCRTKQILNTKLHTRAS